MYNKEAQRKWREANPERARQLQKDYHTRPEIKERYAEHSRNWRAKNKQRAAEIDARKYETGKERHRQRRMLSGAKERAAQQGLPFDLTVDDIIIPPCCPVLGIDLKAGNNNTRPELDRIIPSMGYVKGNVCVISGRANRIKWNATEEELEALLNYVRTKSTSG